MTLYLALDTATDRPTLALGTREEPGQDTVLPTRRELSREIERVAAGLLESRGVQLRHLAGVVVADGPGSFTGLRIGIAFAKGVCRALGLPLLVAPSLLGAASAAASGAETVLVCYDALRGDVYRAAYRFFPAGPGLPRSSRVEVIVAPELAGAQAPPPIPEPLGRADASRASAAALLGLIGVAGGAVPVRDPAAWEPTYGRPAEAEARLMALHAQRPDAPTP